MDAQPLPPPDSEVAPTEPSSITDRLANVICAPGEVFEEIKNAPVRVSNWLLPLILACLGTGVYIFIAFSQPAVLRGMQEQQEQRMQKQVASGKMTQAQADQALAITQKFMSPAIMRIAGAGAGMVSSAVGLFLIGLVIWLALKIFVKAQIGYMKVIEVCGLALLIDVPQKLIRSGLVVWKENMFVTASPTIFLAHPSQSDKLTQWLSMLDVVDFWWLAVLSLGVSKVASVSYRTAALLVFGLWYGFRIVAAAWTLIAS